VKLNYFYVFMSISQNITFKLAITLSFVCLSPSYGQQIAPAFKVKDKDGKTIIIADLKGKVVFINFWALTCIPCRQEMPTINQLAAHFKDNKDVVILPVSLDYNFTTTYAFMKEQGLALNVYSPSGAMPDALFQGVLPTTIVIDKLGKVVFYKQEEGDYGKDGFIQFIEGLLK